MVTELLFERHSYYLKYQVQLVLDGGAGEERSAGGHLIENASHAPHINGGRVLGGAQQHVRGPARIKIMIMIGSTNTLKSK